MTTTLKIPKTLAACADAYYKKRQSRLDLQKQVDALQEEETLLKDHLINNLPKSDATGVQGKLCRVSVVTDIKPVVKDWEKLTEYIGKNRKKGAFALLNRAINAKSVKELWEAGKKVPGVETFNVVTLSINKL